MICPVCGTHIDDGSVVCRACHARISVVRTTKREQRRWCSSCGVRLSWDDDICPHCGLPQERARITIPLSQIPEIGSQDLAADEWENDELEELAETLAIEELQAEWQEHLDAEPAVQRVAGLEAFDDDEMPPQRPVLFSLFASLAVMACLVLLVTHPWDSGTPSADTSEASGTATVGFPGSAEEASGHNDASATTSEGDDKAFAQLTDIYGTLMRYEERADSNEELYFKASKTGVTIELTQGRRACEALSIDVASLLERLSRVDVSSGTYAEDLDHLARLGNMLQKRVTALVSVWEATVSPDGDAADISAGLQVQSKYRHIFERHCGSWEPKQK